MILYEEDALMEGQFQNWFIKYYSDNFHREDVPRSRRLVECDENKIRWLSEIIDIFIPNKNLLLYDFEKFNVYSAVYIEGENT